MDSKQHPEGLPFSPEGEGWTKQTKQPTSDQRTRLLTSRNIDAMRKHEPDRWDELSVKLSEASLPSRMDPKTGRLRSSLSDEERDKLIALSLLRDKGVVNEGVAT